MRVIAGTHRSRVLLEVGKDSTRETKDRVKESIFNSLSPYLFEANVLDLFSGSGSLGIEALSRGAVFCDFVDCENEAVKTTHANLKNLNLLNQSTVTYGRYEEYLLRVDKTFDVILLDPPYDMLVLDDIIETIAKRKLLNEQGIIVCLYSKKNGLKPHNFGIIEDKMKQIGITKVSYMKWGSL